MKIFRRCPLVIMLAVSLLIAEVITGIPKILAFAEKQMNRKEYRVESLPQYASETEENVTGNTVSEGSVSGDAVSGSDVSWNTVSGQEPYSDGISGNMVSGNDGVQNSASGNSVSDNGGIPSAAFVEVTEDYFADALFIGDSRTVGLKEYSGMEQATFYASTGLTVYKVFTEKIVSVPGSKQKITVEEALSRRQFGKIYFMIGINEMGRGTVDTFMEEYRKVVAHLQELQPDATIFVQAIMRVTTERSRKGDYINNEGINARNEQIAQLADNRKIFYLDVNPLICDETGGMNAAYTFDGVHLKAEYVPIWTDYLAAHGITGVN